MVRVGWLLASALSVTACTSLSREELLAGKACAGVDRRCAPGYGCRSDGICVPEGDLAAADGGTAGGGTAGGGTAGGGTASGGTAGGGTASGGTASGGTASGGTAGGGTAGGGTAGGGTAGGGQQGDTGGASGGSEPGTGARAAGGADSEGGNGGGGATTKGCEARARDCEVIASALRHRYRFDGTSTVVFDDVGGANGSAEAGAIQDGGELILSGGGYVDLPNGLASALANATFEVWAVWNGGDIGQRIFDFGDVFAGTACPESGDAAPEGAPGVCTRTSIYLSPAAAGGLGQGDLLASVRVPQGTLGIERTDVYMAVPLPTGAVQHLAVVVDDANDQLRLYLDGQPVAATTFTGSLADVSDVNCWLGLAQPASHPAFDGRLLEFRIYGEALTDDEIDTSFVEGPDADSLG